MNYTEQEVKMGNSKVLITGGCGFIGTHLSRRLVEMGKEVTVLDIAVPKEDNLYRIKVEGDIRNKELVGELMKGVDTVYHLAAMTTFGECRDEPRKALDINGYGTITILKEAMRCGAGNVVFFSSASVYSGNKEPVKHEKMRLAPKSIYGITKLMGERLCKDATNHGGLPCAILRPFNVYGENGRGVINVFARAIENDRRITIYGNGSQTRDYIHVDDVVEVAVAMGIGKLSGAYNVGTGGRCSLLELKGMMEKISGIGFKVEWQPQEPWDLQELVADTTKIREILPTTIPLEEGIKTLLATYSP